MKKIILLSLVILVSFQSWGWARSMYWPVDPQESSITFTGKSTLHDFKGQVGIVRGELVFNGQDPMAHGHVEVDVRSFNTDNKDRDNQMFIMFNSTIFPSVSFDIEKADLSHLKALMQGTLNIHGVSRPFNIEANVVINKDRYVCEGRFNVSLKDFELKPPSFLGLIKVYDQINVNFKVSFQNSK